MDHITVVLVCYISECCNWEGMSYKIKELFKGKTTTVEPPLTDILYSGHLIMQDKMLWSGLNLHYA